MCGTIERCHRHLIAGFDTRLLMGHRPIHGHSPLLSYKWVSPPIKVDKACYECGSLSLPLSPALMPRDCGHSSGHACLAEAQVVGGRPPGGASQAYVFLPSFTVTQESSNNNLGASEMAELCRHSALQRGTKRGLTYCGGHFIYS